MKSHILLCGYTVNKPLFIYLYLFLHRSKPFYIFCTLLVKPIFNLRVEFIRSLHGS